MTELDPTDQNSMAWKRLVTMLALALSGVGASEENQWRVQGLALISMAVPWLMLLWATIMIWWRDDQKFISRRQIADQSQPPAEDDVFITVKRHHLEVAAFLFKTLVVKFIFGTLLIYLFSGSPILVFAENSMTIFDLTVHPLMRYHYKTVNE